MAQVFTTAWMHLILLFNANFNLGKTASQVSMGPITIQQVDLDILPMQLTLAHLVFILVFIHFFM